MNLTWRIVAKDFALLRGRLAVWLVVVAAKFALGIVVVRWAQVNSELLAQLQLVAAVLIVVDIAFTLLLGALLVQEDGVAGTAAFWRTRPISRSRLLAAKLLSAGTLLVAPAILPALPWWWVCGLDAAQMARAALEVALFQIAVLSVAFAAAAVTTTLGRCLVWGIVAFAAVNVGVGVANQSMPWLALTPAVLVPLLFLVLVATVAVQYLTLRRSRALTVLAIGGAAALVLPSLLVVAGGGSPDTVRGQFPRDPEVRPEVARGVAVKFLSAQGREQKYGNGRKIEWITMEFEASGLPAGLHAKVLFATMRWQWANEPKAPPLDSWGN